MENFITTSIVRKINPTAIENLNNLNLRVEDLTFEQIFKFASRFEIAKLVAKMALRRISNLVVEIEAEGLLDIPRAVNKKNGIEKRAKEQIQFLLELLCSLDHINLEEIANLTPFDLLSE